MIPLTTLYDYYIDRPKLSEQKEGSEQKVRPEKGIICHALLKKVAKEFSLEVETQL